MKTAGHQPARARKASPTSEHRRELSCAEVSGPLEAGADSVLAASIFHDGDYRVADIKRVMAAAGIPTRMDSHET